MKVKIGKRNILSKTHGPIKAGSVVDVSEETGKWLVKEKLATKVNEEKKKSTTKKKD